jgi:hypothetical protein
MSEAPGQQPADGTGPGGPGPSGDSGRPAGSGDPGRPSGSGDPGRPGSGDPGAPPPREMWSEVGRRFQHLGRAVRTHLDPESPDAATWTPPPPGGWDESRRRDDDQWTGRSEARDTVRRLGRTAQLLASQAGEAVRDPVVRSSAAEAARSLGAALSRAAEDFAGQLRENVRSPRWSDPTRPRPQPPVAPVDPEDDRREP